MWRESDHQRAMQPANSVTVLGKFDGRTLTHQGTTSRFSQRNGKYIVRTDGPDGALYDYDILYTFGAWPLQQYLVALPGGRLQALEVAWDNRASSEGGQQWFHLYPSEKNAHDDPLHWSGLTENWNGMCADCHSTNVRKGYDDRTATFSTTSAEVSVGCEACHGPGSRHVAWAQHGGDKRRNRAGAESFGLTIDLSERKGVSWTRDASSREASTEPSAYNFEGNRDVRSMPCASRSGARGRGPRASAGGRLPRRPARRGALFPRRPIKGEVYEYGSFLQSKMFAHGVTCGDCHEPHRPEQKAKTNGVCLQCHAESTYQNPKHHFHGADSPGARCVGCHMPAATFMVVDERRDHSFRLPRPDLTVKLGVPNACNGCHASRSARWAAETVRRWYGHDPAGNQRFAEALAAGRKGAADAPELLTTLIADRTQPSIARATALELLQGRVGINQLELVRTSLADGDALVRRATIRALARSEPRMRMAMLGPLTGDPVRTVRLEAVAVLADLPYPLENELGPSQGRAVAEYIDVQNLNAERPESHLDLALLFANLSPDRVESSLGRALEIDPTFVPAAVNLADHYRRAHRDRDAESVLRKALLRSHDNAPLWEALGLALVRQSRMGEALQALGQAASLAPDDARMGYVRAVALHDQGKRAEAIHELERVARRHPGDGDTLSALATYQRESADLEGTGEAVAAPRAPRGAEGRAVAPPGIPSVVSGR